MSKSSSSHYCRLILDLCHGAIDADTMRTAAEFARLIGLDLHCLLIEDEALLALAELPFAREIRLPTHVWRPLDAGTIATELAQMATQTRRLLDEVARTVGVASAFEVLRGDPAACITAVCQAGDIVVVVEPGTPAARVTHGAARLHAAAHASAASVLLLPARFKSRTGPVVVLLTGATDGCLDLACRIATAADEDLIVLLLQAEMGAVADAVRERAHSLGLPLEQIAVHTVRSDQQIDKLHALSNVHERLILATRAMLSGDNAAALPQLAAARGVPVLLIEPDCRADRPPASQRRKNVSTIVGNGSSGSSANS